MAKKTQVTYIGDGVQKVWSFDFDYLKKTFIKVKLGTTTPTYGTDYTVNSKQLIFTTAPANGVVFTIYRATDTTKLVTFIDGSVLRAGDLTTFEIQLLHLAEETDDKVTTQATEEADRAEAAANSSATFAQASSASTTQAANSATQAAQSATQAASSATQAADSAAQAAASAAIMATHTHDENIGEIKTFARKTAPNKFLKCDGKTIGNASSGATARANVDMQALFEMIWNDWANTETPIQDSTGATTTRGTNATADFNANKRLPLPDMRGEFPRGFDDGRGVDAGRVFGSKQADAFQSHYHHVYQCMGTGSSSTSNNGGVLNGNDTWSVHTAMAKDMLSDGTNGTPRIAAETRPRNIALLYCIRYMG